tara:strand:- start:79 stop:267 length:189 start_codon:yes stop_codon:yes gene_type:complete
MWHYIKYLLKLLTGFMIIGALDTMLKKIGIDKKDDYWWFYITLILYNGYCYLEFRLEDKDND